MKEARTFMGLGGESRQTIGVEQTSDFPGFFCLEWHYLSATQGNKCHVPLLLHTHRRSGDIPVYLSEMIPHITLTGIEII